MSKFSNVYCSNDLLNKKIPYNYLLIIGTQSVFNEEFHCIVLLIAVHVCIHHVFTYTLVQHVYVCIICNSAWDVCKGMCTCVHIICELEHNIYFVEV